MKRRNRRTLDDVADRLDRLESLNQEMTDILHQLALEALGVSREEEKP